MNMQTPDYTEQNPTPGAAPLPPITMQQRLRESILALACSGMTIAMSMVLSLIKLYNMPQGGSLTAASMLPVMFSALAFGPLWGLGACAAYGILQFIFDPFAAHWASVILDYPLAFGVLGLSGFFAMNLRERLAERNILRRISRLSVWRMTAAIGIGMAGRFACHLLSGVIFYAEYAGDQNPWIYSTIYNGSYMLPEAVLTCLLMVYLAAAFRTTRVRSRS